MYWSLIINYNQLIGYPELIGVQKYNIFVIYAFITYSNYCLHLSYLSTRSLTYWDSWIFSNIKFWSSCEFQSHFKCNDHQGQLSLGLRPDGLGSPHFHSASAYPLKFRFAGRMPEWGKRKNDNCLNWFVLLYPSLHVDDSQEASMEFLIILWDHMSFLQRSLWGLSQCLVPWCEKSAFPWQLETFVLSPPNDGSLLHSILLLNHSSRYRIIG